MHATQPAIVTQLTLTPRSLVPAKRCILDAYRHRQSLQSPRLPLGQLARPYHPAPCLFTATTSPLKALPCSLPCPVQCSISIVNCRDASARARGDDRPYQPPKLPLTQLQSTFNQQACHNRHPRTSTIGSHPDRSPSITVMHASSPYPLLKRPTQGGLVALIFRVIQCYGHRSSNARSNHCRRPTSEPSYVISR